MSRTVKMQRGSRYTERLPQGCKLCTKGAKLVLLVTGRCSRRCYYCPLSTQKKGKDVFYANEKRIVDISEALEEADLMDALGTGMTGGDPLLAIERTVSSIRALKKHFGAEHHIHLYTSITSPERIGRVARAGLDEIRFHPPSGQWCRLHRSGFADAIRLSKRRSMSVGMEIPAIPDMAEGLRRAIAFADEMQLDFVNLNELESSETNWRSLRLRGFDVRDDDEISSGIGGSEELALELLKMDVDVPLHYCSSGFKDGVQLRRRIVRRARNVRRPHELLTPDGTLLKGVIETDDPEGVATSIAQRFGVPRKLLWNDSEKGRLEVASWVLREISLELDVPCFLVEEYPTADRLEVEREPLRRR
ncbi:MAG: radical SAM protein [Thermoplasmata archaeon]|nr:radical SAM protein [Thermoplasmata archaeon]